MTRIGLSLVLLACPAPLAAQAIAPGDWDLKSTAVELSVPGLPGFMARMMKGKSRTEHKCVSPDAAKTGIAALFVPNPKANCRVTRSLIAGGRIDHSMLCPQKQGEPLTVNRTGNYTDAGFSAQMTMAGQTPKGPMRIVATQVARHAGAACRK